MSQACPRRTHSLPRLRLPLDTLPLTTLGDTVHSRKMKVVRVGEMAVHLGEGAPRRRKLLTVMAVRRKEFYKPTVESRDSRRGEEVSVCQATPRTIYLRHPSNPFPHTLSSLTTLTTCLSQSSWPSSFSQCPFPCWSLPLPEAQARRDESPAAPAIAAPRGQQQRPPAADACCVAAVPM